jgi:hypothetical protein
VVPVIVVAEKVFALNPPVKLVGPVTVPPVNDDPLGCPDE